jgi:putative endonuclease
MSWYTYVFYNHTLNKFYIGSTNNLKRRIKEHQNKKTQTTSRGGEWKLVYFEVCLSKKDA